MGLIQKLCAVLVLFGFIGAAMPSRASGEPLDGEGVTGSNSVWHLRGECVEVAELQRTLEGLNKLYPPIKSVVVTDRTKMRELFSQIKETVSELPYPIKGGNWGWVIIKTEGDKVLNEGGLVDLRYAITYVQEGANYCFTHAPAATATK